MWGRQGGRRLTCPPAHAGMGNGCCTQLQEPLSSAKADEVTPTVKDAAGLPPPYASPPPTVPEGWVVTLPGNTMRILCAVSTMPASRAMRNNDNANKVELHVRFSASTSLGFTVHAWTTPGKAKGFSSAFPLKCVLPSQIPGFISIVETEADATPLELEELGRMLRALFDDKKLPEAVVL